MPTRKQSEAQDEALKPKLLIVEDEESIRTQMRWSLGKDYAVLLAENREQALELQLRENPGVIVLDLGLPPQPDGVEEGFAVLAGLHESNPLAKIIIVTGKTDKEFALKGIADGAYDFLSKPIDPEELKIILKRAFHVYQLEQENRQWHRVIGEEAFEGMLGTSPCMQQVFTSIRKVATTDASVLVMGENGTGKELVARAIHRLGARKNGPFIAINCSAIPENLLESELFGHEKGAFTGAHIHRKGRIEMAMGGTLFLDEIGDLSLALQVKLLRFLQERCIERVGGRELIEVDVRVMAATNIDLQHAMKEGLFREDLYYRLGVVVISVPPLRDRGDDILLLARVLLQKFAEENRKKITGFTPKALKVLTTYSWPGNVRELENRIKRAVIMTEESKVTPMDLDLLDSRFTQEGRSLKKAKEALEKDMVQQALNRHKGNLTKAATQLGISRPTLYELMDKLGILRE